MLHDQMAKKCEIKSEKYSETSGIEILELENTGFHVIKRPGASLKLKMRKMALIQSIAGVLRDILTKFQENRSSRSQ